MSQELKIRMPSKSEILTRLKAIGATFEDTVDTEHTYFNQNGGKVLKIVIKDDKPFIHKLHEENGLFVFDSREPIKDLATELEKLEKEFGIKLKQKMHAENYKYKEYTIGLYDVEKLGEFLILEGDNPTEEQLEDWLGIQNPEIITKSFSDI